MPEPHGRRARRPVRASWSSSPECGPGSAALGALLRLDARLGTHHADRFTRPDGLWDQWVNALAHLRGDLSYTPAEFRRRTDLRCDFANGWTRPRS
ncbi:MULTISPECIES: DUF6000 family protein [Streptomyces]|uniref:DUF6000 family protein n=1 Tax=Streptomyces TaxID=1883 RepID=UPI0027DA494C|nr:MULTISPECIES: DUF6000 family protein [unclassified Streptomyces]